MDAPRMTCRDDQRRTALREEGLLNGIDYVEAEAIEGRVVLHVYLIGDLPPDDTAWLDKGNITITGPSALDVAEVEIRHAPDEERDDRIDVTLSQDWPADRAPYTLHLVGTDEHPLDDLDPRYASATFVFLPVDATSDVDCLAPASCPPEPSTTPDLDYLAKDYASFRRLLLDRLAVTLPGWRDHETPDLLLTLVEVLAYHADHLSYAQDAVATEAYLDTARMRTSVRRHARLVDYRLHEGCNSRAWVCLEVSGDPEIRIDRIQLITRPEGVPANVPLLLEDQIRLAPRATYEVFEPLPEQGWEEIVERDIRDPRAIADRVLHEESDEMRAIRESPASVLTSLKEALDAGDLARLTVLLARLLGSLLDDPGFALAGDATAPRPANTPHGARMRRRGRCRLQELFPAEIVQPASYRFHEDHNEIHFHTWHDAECCLPRGATSATLRDRQPDGSTRRALEHLRAGDVLILEEILNPRTGNSADTDPRHRHPVRLTSVEPGVDPLGDVPIVEIAWDPADALPFDLTISAIGPAPECALLERVTVARGNVILVDHGETVREPEPIELHDGARTFIAVPFEPDDLVPARDLDWCCAGEGRLDETPLVADRYEPHLAQSPLVHAQPLPAMVPAATQALIQDPRLARPQVSLFSPIDRVRPWTDELEHVVDGAVAGWYERWLPRLDLLGSDADDRHFVVEVDDGGVAHIRFGDGELGARPVADTRYRAWYRTGGGPAGNVGREAISVMLLRGSIDGGDVRCVRNPLPASGGTAPEPVAQARLLAPHEFRATLQRAVTLEDYATIAVRDFPDRIQRALARDTSVVDNRTIVELILDLTGTEEDDPAFLNEVVAHLEPFRRIGHHLRPVPATYAGIDLSLKIKLASHYQWGAVLRAVRDRFSDRIQRDGRPGFFHPDQLTFGQGIAVSQVVAAAMAIPGVAGVKVTNLERSGAPPRVPSIDVLALEAWEIARLDNDPHHPERGILRIEEETS